MTSIHSVYYNYFRRLFPIVISIKGLVFLYALLAVACASQAQDSSFLAKNRVLFILNSSISMEQSWHRDTTKFQAASSIIERVMDSIYKYDDHVEFGLHAYGQLYPAGQTNCRDAKREVLFTRDNRTQIALRMENLPNRGVSPVAFALRQAMEEEMNAAKKIHYFFVLVTDGDENCDGDICDVLHIYAERHVSYSSCTVMLVDFEGFRQYECLGNYLRAERESSTPGIVQRITELYREMQAGQMTRQN